MKALIAASLLFVLLLGIILANALYVRHVAFEIQDRLARLTEDTLTSESLAQLTAYWEKHKKFLSLSVPFRDVAALSQALLSMCAAEQSNNLSDFHLYRNLAMDASHALLRLEYFSIENLL